ncbi:MAG TPA: DUF2752 domain-containing protein [Candidatus Angelobacter sp.]|nr:DUF2752 domain-containing protein [Candidatus Angelobacter sp.]
MNQKTLTGMASAAMLAALAVVYAFPPEEYSFYPRCLIYTTTHWLCPGCGSTRALHALLHLDLRSALHYNALFTVLAPFAFLWIAFCCYRVLRYDQFPQLAMPRALTVGLVVSAVLFTVARNTLFAF